MVQELNITEKGTVLIHIKKYDFQARYDISCSSFRANLATAFAPLLYDEVSRIEVVFKVFEGVFEMLYNEGEETLYPPQISRPDCEGGFYFCSSCGKGYYKAGRCPECGAARGRRAGRTVTGTSRGSASISKVSRA